MKLTKNFVIIASSLWTRYLRKELYARVAINVIHSHLFTFTCAFPLIVNIIIECTPWSLTITEACWQKYIFQ